MNSRGTLEIVRRFINLSLAFISTLNSTANATLFKINCLEYYVMYEVEIS